MPLRVYLVEDEPMVLDFCSEYIRRYTDMEIAGASGNGHDALKSILETKPDIVIVDIRLPEVNGLEILILLKEKLPACKVLIFTGTVNAQTVRVALQARVDAFVEKGDGLDGLRSGLDALKLGKRYFSPHIKKMMEAYEVDMGSRYPFSPVSGK